MLKISLSKLESIQTYKVDWLLQSIHIFFSFPSVNSHGVKKSLRIRVGIMSTILIVPMEKKKNNSIQYMLLEKLLNKSLFMNPCMQLLTFIQLKKVNYSINSISLLQEFYEIKIKYRILYTWIIQYTSNSAGGLIRLMCCFRVYETC